MLIPRGLKLRYSKMFAPKHEAGKKKQFRAAGSAIIWLSLLLKKIIASGEDKPKSLLHRMCGWAHGISVLQCVCREEKVSGSCCPISPCQPYRGARIKIFLLPVLLEPRHVHHFNSKSSGNIEVLEDGAAAMVVTGTNNSWAWSSFHTWRQGWVEGGRSGLCSMIAG